MGFLLPPRLAEKSWAFTVVELLSVLALVGILAAFLIPFASRMMGKGRDVQCLRNLQVIYTGIRLYAGENENQVPMISGTAYGLKWHYYIQDYMRSTFETTNVTPYFLCPADKSGNTMTYDMNQNLENKRFNSIAGNVLLLTESSGTYSIKGDEASIGTLLYNHLGGKAVNVLHVDGSIQSQASVPDSKADPALWIP